MKKTKLVTSYYAHHAGSPVWGQVNRDRWYRYSLVGMANISFYGSHNAAFVIEKDGEIVEIVEVERLVNSKNQGVAQYITLRSKDILFLTKLMIKNIMEKHSITEFDTCLFLNTEVDYHHIHHLERFIPAKKYKPYHHHQAHAAGCFYQSPYQEALVISFDGGGDDGKFNIYYANREDSVTLLESVKSENEDIFIPQYDLGFPYMIFGHYLKDIRFMDLSIGNLVYPGKIMGLVSYGKVRKEWIPAFMKFYKSSPSGIFLPEENCMDCELKIKELGESIGIVFDINNRLEGQNAYDIAATSQKVFEECFLEKVNPYIKKYPDKPLCITGGCGLNIILNTRMKRRHKSGVFIGPNPNDCGVATGGMLHFLRPKTPIDITYKGLPLLDLNMLPQYIHLCQEQIKCYDLDMYMLVEDLKQGHIIGVARGGSEHGPRALGNRSILCNPSIENMKDTLNEKVKHREWYRPFAPVVRLEDVSEYFEWEGESRWMSFSSVVKKRWRKKLQAITHVDNTARVQTVTREQNEWLYDLLTRFKEATGIGVLLNTSFNVDGKPILTTVKDAFYILENTQMDCIVIENYYIRKQKEEFI